MSKKVLIMGLPGAGKTTFASRLKKYLENNKVTVDWFNADMIRTQHNDWDFSVEGRIRQSNRMFKLTETSNKDFIICDFIAPLQETRDKFAADYVIWLDTIGHSRYQDTNDIFERPNKYHFRITKDIITNAVETVAITLLKEHNEKN